MKKLISKIRNKKLKGNISLLVILILLASSVISLLSINQIQHLLSYGNMTFNYFRSFYLAKAWTELWLVEVYNSHDGFHHKILSGDFIVTWNLLPNYEWFHPYFDMNIVWSFDILTDDIRNAECSWNKIKLAPWAWIMLSLFSDETSNLNDILSDNKQFKKLNDIEELSLIEKDEKSELTFAFFTYETDSNWEEYMEDIVVDQSTSLSNFLSKDDVKTLIKNDVMKKYLTIKNPWDEEIEFCIQNKNNKEIPYSDSLITVIANYGDMEVWLQSIVKKWIPDWTLNVLDDN